MYAQKPIRHTIEITQSGDRNNVVTLELGDDTKAAIEVFDKIRYGTRQTRDGYANLFAIVPLPDRDFNGATDDDRYMQVIVAQHSWESE